MTREVADRIAAGMVAAWENRVRHVDGHVLHSEDGVVVCLSNLDPELDVALIEREPEEPLGPLTHAESLFEANGRAFQRRDRARPPYERGSRRPRDRSLDRGRRPAMAIRVADLARTRPPPGLRIRPVRTPEEISQMVEIEVRVFGTERAVAERFIGPSLLTVQEIRPLRRHARRRGREHGADEPARGCPGRVRGGHGARTAPGGSAPP